MRGELASNGGGGPFGELGDRKLVALLQVLSVLLNEVSGGDVLDGVESLVAHCVMIDQIPFISD